MKTAKFAFEKKLIEFSNQNNLFAKGEKVLVCLSGGSDSVCLLYAMYNCREFFDFEIYACHVNHMIRGEEAERDEQFCKKLCGKLGIILFSGKFDVPGIAQEKKKSVELAAREVRYSFFDKIVSENGIDKIVTAHNKNDNAETLLMNYIRGSGLEGLCGIDVKRENIVRPLLCMEKKEILDYLEANNAEYVTDSTNLSVEYTRNKIRLELIGYINKNLNPSFCKTVTQNSKILRMENEFMTEVCEGSEKTCVFDDTKGKYIDISKYEKLHKAIRYRVLRSFMQKNLGSVSDIGYATIERMDKLKKGKVAVCAGFEAVASYGKLRIEKAVKKDKILYEYEISAGEEVCILETGCVVKTEIIEKSEYKKEKNSEYFDFDKLKSDKLVVRNRRNGDAILIKSGTKKLKNLFIDLKIEQSEREKKVLIVCGGDILWVCGLRRCDRFKVENNTKRILKISYNEGDKNENS